MKIYESVTMIFFCTLIIVVGFGLVSQKWLGDDNEIEQVAEVVIKEETGVDVDLSPGD
jgi:hypothetical protein